MDPEKNVQAEDRPVINEPEKKGAVENVSPTPKKSIMDRALPWLIVGLVCFLGGALVTYFALYQPKIAELTTDQTDLAAASENVAELQSQLDTSKSELTSANATIEELTLSLAASEKLRLIYKFQADVNSAQASLTNHEPTSARQALGYASDDLSDLEKTDLDADTLAGFKTKIEEANNKLNSDPDSAIDTLTTLQSDLLNMISHLE
jgi:chromosome segregation ATPase